MGLYGALLVCVVACIVGVVAAVPATHVAVRMTSFLCLRACPGGEWMWKQSFKGNLRLSGRSRAGRILQRHGFPFCALSLFSGLLSRLSLACLLELRAAAVEDESFRIKSSSTGLSLECEDLV